MKKLITIILVYIFTIGMATAQERMYIYKSGVVIDKYNTSEIDSIIFYANTPSLTTNGVTEITLSSAQSGGNIYNDGGEEVSERGVCWNTNGNPIYNDHKTSNGSGSGVFVSEISGLLPGQTYYVRAYARNSVGLSYGNQQMFTTLSAVPPTIHNDLTIQLSSNSATISVKLVSDGGSNISAKGIVWSKTVSSPDLNNNDGKTNDGSGFSDYTSTITGLSPNTSYYARAYATNGAGTGYGSMFTFKTNENKIVDAEGNEYGTVALGNLTWMTENLRTTKFNNNQVINESWDYNNDPGKRIPYGRLYSWNAATDSRNACPAGWRLPSSEEWDQMMEYLRNNGYSSSSDQVKAISSKTGWANSTYEGTPGFQPEKNNGSGFSAVPAGLRSSWGFENMDYITWWWTSDDWTENTAYGYYKSIKYDQNYMGTYVDTKETGFSVRCVKEEGAAPSPTTPGVTTEGSTNVSANAATIQGKVLSDGGAVISQRGFYWSETNSNPDQSSNVEFVSGTTGDFSKTISGLKENTTYYFRAFAANSIGTTLGDVITFKTQSSGGGGGTNTFTDQRDGNIYKTVTIGSQVWMAENLKYLPSVVGAGTVSQISPYFYVLGYNGTNVTEAKATSNYNTYGVLYNWPAALNKAESSTANPSGVQGVCPIGWHLPSDTEWTQLTDYLGGTSVAGGKLKETGTTHWISPNRGATNETSYTALPGGYRSYADDLIGETFIGIGYFGMWWSATEYNSNKAWHRSMYYDNSNVYRDGANKDDGFSVRCVKD